MTCHDGAGAGSGVTQVSTHANTSTTMTALSAVDRYAAQRLAFELNCVECHDVHGTTNISMINPSNPDGPLVAPRTYGGSADTATYLFNSTAVAFTARAAGADYAATSANAAKICQTCHTLTGAGPPDTNPVYRHNSGTTGHDTAVCTQCHYHDIDDTFTAASQDGFMPRKNCMNCHNGSTAGPNVIDGTLATNASLNYNWFGTQAGKQDGGHGDADVGTYMVGSTPTPRPNAAALACTACHEIGPAHLNGTYNSVFTNLNRTANTAHLKPGYFPGGAGYATQLNFDSYCTSQCHPASQIGAMTHADSDPAAGVVRMGDHLTISNGDSISYPMDQDLSTNASGATYYAPCVACHDPHGTTAAEPAKNNLNRMLRDQWVTTNPLCNKCH